MTARERAIAEARARVLKARERLASLEQAEGDHQQTASYERGWRRALEQAEAELASLGTDPKAG